MPLCVTGRKKTDTDCRSLSPLHLHFGTVDTYIMHGTIPCRCQPGNAQGAAPPAQLQGGAPCVRCQMRRPALRCQARAAPPLFSPACLHHSLCIMLIMCCRGLLQRPCARTHTTERIGAAPPLPGQPTLHHVFSPHSLFPACAPRVRCGLLLTEAPPQTYHALLGLCIGRLRL